MVSIIQESKEAKLPSISSQVIALPVNGKAKVSISRRPYLSSLISGNIKYKFPEREYTLYIDPKNDQLLIIERLA